MSESPAQELDTTNFSITLFKDWLLNWEHVHVIRDRSGGDSVSRKALVIHRSTLNCDVIRKAADDLNYRLVGCNELQDVVSTSDSPCIFSDGDIENTDSNNLRREKVILVIQNVDDIEDVDFLQDIERKIRTSHQPIVLIYNNEYLQSSLITAGIRRRSHVLETDIRPEITQPNNNH